MKCVFVLQVSTEDIVKEVENSVEEFKQSKQEYDEERVREQVSMWYPSHKVDCCCKLAIWNSWKDQSLKETDYKKCTLPILISQMCLMLLSLYLK